MDRTRILASIAASLTLAACGQGVSPPAPENAIATPEATVPSPAPPAPAPTPIPAVTAAPDLAPPVLTPEAERGETGARNLLLTFARAIELGDHGAAWRLLSPADRRKWSRAAFAGMFADLVEPTVAIPTGRMEGAAGSSYYTAPVTITGADREGRPVRLEGEVVLRRVNDVDGATAAQRRWRFETLTLDWTH